MSPVQRKPIIHGRDHACGGSDPIPGICDLFPPIPTSFYDAMTEIAATTTLLGWWRLGEAASPFADTSGYVLGPTNMVRQVVGTAMTTHVTGALPSGQDDGAAQFNAGLWSSPDNQTGDWLYTSTGHSYLIPTSITLACFLRPLANAGTWRGHAFGNFKPDIVAGLPGGQAIFVDWPTRTVRYIRAQAGSSATTWDEVSGGSLTASAWAFVVGTYDAATQTMRIYINGGLAATTTSTLSPTGETGLAIGRSSAAPASYAGPSYFQRPAWFYGGVDEVSVWAAALTPTQVAELWDAATAASSGGAAGSVPISDGAGGITWGQVGSSSIAADAVTSAAIAADAVGSSELASTTVAAGSYGDATHVATFTVDADGRLLAAANSAITATFNPATATTWWFPLVDTDGTCVLDTDGNLIPTLTPLP